jgi:hypothetical protein
MSAPTGAIYLECHRDGVFSTATPVLIRYFSESNIRFARVSLESSGLLWFGRDARTFLNGLGLRAFLHSGLLLSWPRFTSGGLLPHTNFAFDSGNSRIRFPVAAQMALYNAGAKGGTPGSPTPAGGASLSTMYTFVLRGAEFIRTTS